MDQEEQNLYSDVVKLVNRTDQQLEFMWNAVTYMVPARKSKMLPRFIAMHGVKRNNIKIDSSTGLVMESLFGIEEEGNMYTCDPLHNINLQEIKERPKLDSDQEELEFIVEGKKASMKSKPVPGNRKAKNLVGAI